MLHAAAIARNVRPAPDRRRAGALARPQSTDCLPPALEEHAIRLFFDRNDTIFDEGQPAAHIYIVTSGCTRICHRSQDGRRHVLDFVFPGEFTGFIDCTAYPFRAEAVIETTVIAFPKAQLEVISRTDPSAYDSLISQLSAGLLRSYQHQFVLSCQNAKERMASFIWRTSQRQALLDSVELRMSRRDIADHLGVAVETVCRTIAALKTDGIITTPSPQQCILNKPFELEALAEGRNRRRNTAP